MDNARNCGVLEEQQKDLEVSAKSWVQDLYDLKLCMEDILEKHSFGPRCNVHQLCMEVDLDEQNLCTYIK